MSTLACEADLDVQPRAKTQELVPLIDQISFQIIRLKSETSLLKLTLQGQTYRIAEAQKLLVECNDILCPRQFQLF